MFYLQFCPRIIVSKGDAPEMGLSGGTFTSFQFSGSLVEFGENKSYHTIQQLQMG